MKLAFTTKVLSLMETMREKDCLKILTKGSFTIKEISRRVSFTAKATLNGLIALNLLTIRILRSTREILRMVDQMDRA